MTASKTEWLKIGEPTGNDRVSVELRTTYQTGPYESQDDDVMDAVAEMELIELIHDNTEVEQHKHEDGSIMLSALSDETRGEMMKMVKPLEGIERLLSEGCTPAEAVDYNAVEYDGWSQSSWARIVRDADPSTVSENVAKASEKLD